MNAKQKQALTEEQKRKIVLERFNNDIFAKQGMAETLRDCIDINSKDLGAASLRERIILSGFAGRWDLETLDRTLLENDCPALYARSFTEATLIYAFQKGYSLREWADLDETCAKLRDNLADSAYFNNKAILLTELFRYVKDGTEVGNSEAATKMLTHQIEKGIAAQKEDAQLYQFLLENMQTFSGVREKTRYYFCKYLAYYLGNLFQNYETASHLQRGKRGGRKQAEGLPDSLESPGMGGIKRQKDGPYKVNVEALEPDIKHLTQLMQESADAPDSEEEALQSDLLKEVEGIIADLKFETLDVRLKKLKRSLKGQKISVEYFQEKLLSFTDAAVTKMKKLDDMAVSPGGITRQFNHFYYLYTNEMGWFHLLQACNSNNVKDPLKAAFIQKVIKELEKRAEKEKISLEEKKILKILQNSEMPLSEQYEKALDAYDNYLAKELEMLETASDDEEIPSAYRMQEVVVRDHIRGLRDLNRTTLLAYLLFFTADGKLPEKQRLTAERIDTILENCGFAKLNTRDYFDEFVRKFLQCSPAGRSNFVSENVYDSVERGETSFLYRTQAGVKTYREKLDGIFRRKYEEEKKKKEAEEKKKKTKKHPK